MSFYSISALGSLGIGGADGQTVTAADAGSNSPALSFQKVLENQNELAVAGELVFQSPTAEAQASNNQALPAQTFTSNGVLQQNGELEIGPQDLELPSLPTAGQPNEISPTDLSIDSEPFVPEPDESNGIATVDLGLSLFLLNQPTTIESNSIDGAETEFVDQKTSTSDLAESEILNENSNLLSPLDIASEILLTSFSEVPPTNVVGGATTLNAEFNVEFATENAYSSVNSTNVQASVDTTTPPLIGESAIADDTVVQPLATGSNQDTISSDLSQRGIDLPASHFRPSDGAVEFSASANETSPSNPAGPVGQDALATFDPPDYNAASASSGTTGPPLGGGANTQAELVGGTTLNETDSAALVLPFPVDAAEEAIQPPNSIAPNLSASNSNSSSLLDPANPLDSTENRPQLIFPIAPPPGSATDRNSKSNSGISSSRIGDETQDPISSDDLDQTESSTGSLEGAETASERLPVLRQPNVDNPSSSNSADVTFESLAPTLERDSVLPLVSDSSSPSFETPVLNQSNSAAPQTNHSSSRIAEAATPSTVFTTSTVDQVQLALTTQLKPFEDEPTQTLQVDLNPVELGRLQIRVEQTADELIAQIIATEVTSTEILQQEKETLQQLLNDLELGDATIDISHGQAQDSSSQNQSSSPFPPPRIFNIQQHFSTDQPGPSPLRSANPSSKGVDIIA